MLVGDAAHHINPMTGGGIVSDSDPEEEYQETIHKARAVFKAIEKAESI